MIKNISYIVIGILLATCFGLIWDLHILNKEVSIDHSTLGQVVTFLQSPAKQSEPVTTLKR